MGRVENIRELAEPIVSAAGLELWDVEVGTHLVRVFADRSAGADLDALSTAARALSKALDDHEDLAPTGHYELEVSSPGIERTLRSPEQYRRYVGAAVAVKVARPVEGTRRLRGTLVEVTDGGIVLSLEGPEERQIALGYPDIQRAHLAYEPKDAR
jgi:ribosome maturation factor RimP